MASKIDVSALTFSQEEIQEISKAIYEKAFIISDTEMDKIHAIMTGIKHKEQIPFLGKFGLVGESITGCSVTESTETAPLTDKTWSPEQWGFRLAHCADDLSKQLKLFKRNTKAVTWWDEVDNEVMGFLTFRSLEALLEATFRLNWFGDVNADTVDNGGKLTNGTTVKFFSVLDGFWEQISDIITAGGITAVNIAANSGADYTAQDALASDAAVVTFRKMYAKADPRLKKSAGLFYLVTDSLAENYIDWLEEQTTTNGDLERLENGSMKLKFRGIPIYTMTEWDRLIRAYFDNGVTYDNPHRAILTVKENIPIGLLDKESLAELDIFYDKTLKKNYIDAGIQHDVKVLENYMIRVAIN